MNRFRIIRFSTMLLILTALIPAALTAQDEDALVAFRQGRYSDAVRITNAEIARSPGNMDSYAVQGWSLLALEDWAGAVDLSRRALQVSRFDHRILAVMGEAQYQLGNYLTALQYLQEYASVRPDGPLIDQMYQLMAEVHINLNEFHHADIAYTTAVHITADNALWWSRLGFAREQAGRPDAAASAYRQALSLNPGLAAAREGLERLGVNG
jgi:tetratricopeptide (TPR) repeat protein